MVARIGFVRHGRQSLPNLIDNEFRSQKYPYLTLRTTQYDSAGKAVTYAGRPYLLGDCCGFVR